VYKYNLNEARKAGHRISVHKFEEDYRFPAVLEWVLMNISLITRGYASIPKVSQVTNKKVIGAA